jgi:hypothetical protein
MSYCVLRHRKKRKFVLCLMIFEEDRNRSL